MESCTYILHISCNLSAGESIKDGGGRGGGRGRESLLKWNLVTDASEGGAAPAGEDGGCCACLRGRALMHMHAQYSCVCKIGQEKDRT